MDQFFVWVLSVTVIYILIMIAVAIYVGRKWVEDERQFMIGGKEFGKFITITGNTAILLSGGFLPAIVMHGYNFGIGGMWFYIGWGTGALVSMLTWAVFWRVTGGYTPAEWFEARYGRPGKIAGIGIILVASLAIIGWQFVGSGGIIAGAFNISYETGVWIVGIITILYIVIGGLWSVSVTDMLQWGWIILTCFVILPIYLLATHGFPTAAQLPEGFLNFPFGTAPVLQFGAASVLSFLVSNLFLLQLMVYWTRSAGTRNYRVVPGAWLWTVIIPYTTGVIGAFIGMYARIIIPDVLPNPALAFGELLNYVPIPLAAVCMAGVVAATMSTADTYIVGGINTLIRDLAQQIMKIVESKKLLSMARWATILYGLLCVVLAVTWQHGLQQLIAFGTTLGAPLTIFYLDSWLVKRGNGAGAIACVVTTLLTVFYWNVLTNNFMNVHTLYIAPPLSLIIFYLVSYATGGYKKVVVTDKDAELSDLHKSILVTIYKGYRNLAAVTEYLSYHCDYRTYGLGCANLYKDIEYLIEAGYLKADAERFTAQLFYQATDKGRNLVERIITKEDIDLFKTYKLTSETLTIMKIVEKNPKINIAEIAKAADMSPEQVGPICDYLEEVEYVEAFGLLRHQVVMAEKGRDILKKVAV